jgi:hypothetical protein
MGWGEELKSKKLALRREGYNSVVGSQLPEKYIDVDGFDK